MTTRTLLETGYFRPDVPITINESDIPTGLDLTDADVLELVFVDSVSRMTRSTHQIDLDAVRASEDVADPPVFMCTMYDNDFVQGRIEDYARGVIYMTDDGIAMRLFSARTLKYF